MVPRTRRERSLVAEALSLLSEAVKPEAIETATSRVGVTLSVTPSEFNTSYEFKSDFKCKTLDEAGTLGTSDEEPEYGTIAKLTTKENALLGTATEIICMWHVASKCATKGATTIEIGGVGKVNLPAVDSAEGQEAKKKYKGPIAFDLPRLLARLGEYRAQVTEDCWNNSIWNQGVIQGKQVMGTIADDEIKGGTVKIFGLGESAAATGSTLVGQEDVQVRVTPEGGTEKTYAYSNKAGGSSPTQLNKTAQSIGIASNEQLTAGIKKNFDGENGIAQKIIDLYKSSNEDVEYNTPQFVSALGQTLIDTAVSENMSKQDFWTFILVKHLAETANVDVPTENFEQFIKQHSLNLSLPVQFPQHDLRKKVGVIKPAAKSHPVTSLSTCATTILGQFSKGIISAAIKSGSKDRNWFDVVMKGNGKSSVFKTMYPSLYANVIGQNTRQMMAETAKNGIEALDGTYFAVKGSGEKAKSFTGATGIHAVFNQMLTKVARGEDVKFTIEESEDNGLIIKFDGEKLMTVTVRKDKSEALKLTKGSVSLATLAKVAKAAEPTDDGTITQMVDSQNPDDGSLKLVSDFENDSAGKGGEVDTATVAAGGAAEAENLEELELTQDDADKQIEATIEDLEKIDKMTHDVTELIKAIKAAAPSMESAIESASVYRVQKANKFLGNLTGSGNGSTKKSYLLDFVGLANEDQSEDQIIAWGKQLVGLSEIIEFSLPQELTGFLEKANQDLTENKENAMNHIQILRKFLTETQMREFLFEVSALEFLGQYGLNQNLLDNLTDEIESLPGEEDGMVADEGATSSDSSSSRIDETRWLKLAGLLKD